MIRHLFFDSTLCMINYFCTVQIVSSEVPMLGQSYILMCNVQVTDYISLPHYMSYWWTKNNGSVTQLELEGGTQQKQMDYVCFAHAIKKLISFMPTKSIQ